MQDYVISKGMALHHYKTNKFKTFTLSVYIHRPLTEAEVTMNALLPAVMKQGCASYPDLAAVSKKLEALYGGFFDCGIRKKGEDHIISFNFDFVAPKYVQDDPDYLSEIYRFVAEMICRPLCDENGFKAEYVEREKENLKDYIEGMINDKKQYAAHQCLTKMCHGDPYALYQYGRVEDLPHINSKNLCEHYQKIMENSKIDIFLVGDVDPQPLLKQFASLPRQNPAKAYPVARVFQRKRPVQEVTEAFDVAQGKLSMGFRTNIGFDDPDAFALTLFNSVFGSGAHSKLFNNVREKLSLCYYAYSRLEKQKGIMMVSSGVEFANFQKAHDEILKQLQDICEGKVSDAEMNAAKKAVVNILRSLDDSAFSLEDFYLSGLVAGKVTHIEEYIRRIEETTLEDVVRVAQKIELDTVYYLTGKEA